jgi:hypothetical protein
MKYPISDIPEEFWPTTEDLLKSLKRWAEIADKVRYEGNWDECSLLHSFGDKLARDLQWAIKLIEEKK